MEGLAKSVLKIIIKQIMKSAEEREVQQRDKAWRENFTQSALPQTLEFLEAPSIEAAESLLRSIGTSSAQIAHPLSAGMVSWVNRGLVMPYKEAQMTFILRKMLALFDPYLMQGIDSKSRGVTYLSLLQDLQNVYIEKVDMVELTRCTHCGAVYAFREDKMPQSGSIVCQNCGKTY